MKIQNTPILESKLERHKISYSNENGKIIIGKANMDYNTLIGLVVLPIFAATSIVLLMAWNKMQLSETNQHKVIAFCIFIFLGGLFFLSRLMTKRKANKSLKHLENNVIKIENKFGEHSFDSKNIKDFEYSVDQINENIYQGNLYLVDDKDGKHQLLGFDDENPRYVLDDLKWFAEYFSIHKRLKSMNRKFQVL